MEIWHWYIKDDDGNITATGTEKFTETAQFSEEGIVKAYDGKLIPLSLAQTPEYMNAKTAHEQTLAKEQENAVRRIELKAELAKIMEDIEQEQLGIVRDDYASKRVQAAEIINELRVLEGKLPRKIV